MKPFWVIKGFNVVKEQRLGVSSIKRNLILKAFGFESGPETFHGRIVKAAGFSAHAGANLMAIQ